MKVRYERRAAVFDDYRAGYNTTVTLQSRWVQVFNDDKLAGEVLLTEVPQRQIGRALILAFWIGGICGFAGGIVAGLQLG
jgi:hypothetical protein